MTYIKAFDAIRDLFASLPEAKKRGFSAGHFSFNIPGGRCEVCQGDGTVTVEMQFLADVELICEECKGTRYKPQVLEVRYRGKNIHEVLNLTVKEALKFFAEAPKVTEKLRALEEVGLGYLRLGQSATTLSGGEAQRMKLAAHLQPATREAGRGGNGEKIKRRLLYIFDEPTTGLHFDDVSKLLAAFRRLIEAGGSIVVIEHNLEVIKTADWVIDLGPEGGNRGGKIVGVGPPEAIAKLPGSYTGKYLAPVLNGNGASGSEWRGHSRKVLSRLALGVLRVRFVSFGGYAVAFSRLTLSRHSYTAQLSRKLPKTPRRARRRTARTPGTPRFPRKSPHLPNSPRLKDSFKARTTPKPSRCCGRQSRRIPTTTSPGLTSDLSRTRSAKPTTRSPPTANPSPPSLTFSNRT